MPSISIYAELIPQSAIRMLTPFADKAEADGITVYHLNIGAPDIKSPESAPKAVREFQFDHLPYSNSAGTLSLRKALVEKYYAKLGIDITPDEIIVTNGGSEGVHFALMTVCDKDDEVLVMEPFYCNYSTFAALGHGVVSGEIAVIEVLELVASRLIPDVNSLVGIGSLNLEQYAVVELNDAVRNVCRNIALMASAENTP